MFTAIISNFALTITKYNKEMKKIIIAILAFMPLIGMAQDNVWEVPTDQKQNQPRTSLFGKPKKAQKQEDPKYLAGAVPEVNGDVVFTLDKDVPGMSADDIYQKVYGVFNEIVAESKNDGLQPTSRIAAVNKGEHTIAARINEWLVFTNKFLSLDRTQFIYTLVAQATDGHVKVTMDRISYAYETERGEGLGLRTKAEEWITDKYGLNKKGNKLSKMSGKFRRKTIDRKDNIFGRVSKALGI